MYSNEELAEIREVISGKRILSEEERER